ncbi:MAG: signal peptidase I [Chloroflexota bacterium]|uniref:Peptidase S26 domain-containing protein n=1 Tax=marine metagenome TaxID=408172 RepID=A0A381NXG8_9ZZZZ|nr:signal peptidase I [Chloroflexota bacterium]
MRGLLSFLQGFANIFFSARFRIEGDSMLPLLRHGESVFVVRPRLTWNRLRRGDVVVFERPGGQGWVYIKRIAGLPGEDIKIAGGWVFVDGNLLGEEFVQDASKDGTKEWFNRPDEYFLLGDNRGDSNDSRSFGPVSGELIKGRVWLRCWPLARLCLIGRR